MKKSIKILLLIVVECVALYAAYLIVDHIIYGDLGTYDERKTETYEVREPTDMEHFTDGHPDWLRALYYVPKEKIVRKGSSVENMENLIEIIGETSGYAVVKEGVNWNVYGPEGKAVFENDRKILNPENDPMLYMALELVDDDKLIADRSSGEYFDLEGKPVSSLYTFFNRLNFEHPDALYLSIFAIFMLIAGLLWYLFVGRKPTIA